METIENGIVWRDVPSLQDVQASRCGMIKTKDKVIYPNGGFIRIKRWKGRILRDFDNGNGYRYFTLSFPSRANYYVHRIVAETWCDNPHGYNEINHVDFNRRNNHADNLQWVSRAENMQHNVVNDRVCHGEESGNSKLSEKDIISILNEFVKNPTLNKSQLALRYGIRDTTVHKIVFGKRWTRLYKKWLAENNVNREVFSKSVRRFKNHNYIESHPIESKEAGYSLSRLAQ